MSVCGHLKSDDTPCQRPTADAGARCWQHEAPAPVSAPAPKAPAPKAPEFSERDRAFAATWNACKTLRQARTHLGRNAQRRAIALREQGMEMAHLR